MWFWIGLFIVILVGAIIKEITKDSPTPIASDEEKSRLKDEHLKKFFTPNVEIMPNDSITEHGVRTLRQSILDKTEASLITDDFTKTIALLSRK